MLLLLFLYVIYIQESTMRITCFLGASEMPVCARKLHLELMEVPNK